MIVQGKKSPEKVFLLAIIWAPVFAFLIACGLYFAAVSELKAHVKTYDRGNAALLAAFEKTKQGADGSMIVLGNSRLRHAFTAGFDPREMSVMPDGRRFAVLQLGFDGAGFAAFSDMTNDILRIKPDTLVMMPNVLTNRRATQPFFMDKAVTITMYLNRALGGITPEHSWNYERQYLISQCYSTLLDKRMDQHLDLLAQRDAHDMSAANEDYAAAKSFLARAHAAGIKIVMLDLEPNRDMLEGLGVAAHRIDYPGLGRSPSCRELLPGLADDVRWLSYYPAEGGAHFCDFMHLNAEGRAAFTSWFLTLAAKDWHTAGHCPAPTGR